jgi:endonuclease/exonuclease/phosphatase (EEP) superfamily protein YafD
MTDAQPVTSSSPTARVPRGGQRLLRLASTVLAAGYLLGLVVVALAMPLVGERWWITTALLYLPRFGFALPLPVVVLALGLFGPRKLLLLLPLPLGVLLFPIMGLKLNLTADNSGPGGGAERGTLRVLSYNVAATDDADQVLAIIRGAAPDILLIQEHTDDFQEALDKAMPGLTRHREGQFGLVTRFPLEDVYLPSKIAIPGSPPRSARFVRYRLKTPLGSLQVFNVHPVSPRNGLEEARGDGLLQGLRQGRLGGKEGVAVMQANSFLRQRQVEEIVAEAGRSPQPTIIAGDTNLPDGSWIYRRALARYTDGFSAVGRGFGYTYPASRPWMRIDRILADHQLSFRRFSVLPQIASDHLAVLAELRLR